MKNSLWFRGCAVRTGLTPFRTRALAGGRRWLAGGLGLAFGLGFSGAPCACAQSVSGRVVQVAVADAVCAAVRDASDAPRLAVGVRGTGDWHLAVMPLDQRGNVLTGATERIGFPQTEALLAYHPYPLDAAWHPRLPLLYVWRDLAGPAMVNPAPNPVVREFDHLAVYSLTGGVLRLVGSYARGSDYAWGQATGRMALDPEGKRLFLPNLQPARIGYLVLLTNGLPLAVEGRADPVAVNVGRVGLNPPGFGFLAASDRVVIFSGSFGPVTWDTENRRAALNSVRVRGLTGKCFLGGHPQLAAVFGAAQNGGLLYRVEQADGFLTMLPQVLTIPGAAFTAPPVVWPGKPDRVIIGGVNKIHAVPLDAAGRLTDAYEELPVASRAVKALAYSRKFDRLYVAVEKLP